MERFVRGLTLVLLLSAAAWVLLRVTRGARKPSDGTLLPAPPPASGRRETTGAIREAPDAVDAIPPIKLLREKKKTVRRGEPPLPASPR